MTQPQNPRPSKVAKQYYYELHVTFMPGLNVVTDHAKADVEELNGWKFSAIDGDIILGAGIKLYATLHQNIKVSDENNLQKLRTMHDHLIKKGYEVVRKKIEMVTYDERL